MVQLRTSERRSGRDRRSIAPYPYKGPERRARKHRRSGYDRRNGWPTVCVYCGKACEPDKGWVQGAATIETTVQSQVGLCVECSHKKFPQFYTDE